MRLRNSTTALGILGVALTASSCTASLELDRFHKASTQPVTTDNNNNAPTLNFLDLQFKCTAMSPHIGETLEVRIVDKADNVHAKAVYANITSLNFALFMSKFIPKGDQSTNPYRIDFWADHNKNGKYDGILGGINAADHAWRRILDTPLPDDVALNGNEYDLNFIHDTTFVDIFTNLNGDKISGADTLLPAALTINGADPYAGTMIEIRIVDSASGRLVGLHREGHPATSYTAQITGILDEETSYDISIYADLDKDEMYSPGDPSWKVNLQSTADGLTHTIDLGSEQQAPIDTGQAPKT